MKIALINDSHAGARQESVHFNNYFFEFWDGVFFPYLEKHDIRQVVHLGDLVDRRKFINYVIAHSWRKKFFDRLPGRTDFLVGNHDVPFRNTNTPNAIEELLDGRYPTYGIFTEPVEMHYDGLCVGLVPWINSGNYEKSLDFIKNTKAEVLFGHFEISGFEMDRGHVCDTGLDRSLFERFKAVISGHFHTKSTDGCIFYLGSQYDMTWADYGDTKGFHVFDTTTCELEFIPNPHKMFYKVWYDDKTQDMLYWNTQDLSIYKNRYVKVIVTNKDNPTLFDKMIDAIHRANPVEVAITEDYGTIYEESREMVNQAEDTPTILTKYIDKLIVPDNISKDKLKQLARELYVEALGMENVNG